MPASSSARRLARVIGDGDDAAADRFVIARVAALALPRVVVQIGDGTIAVGRLASYTAPAVGDVALVAKTPTGWVALGKLATS